MQQVIWKKKKRDDVLMLGQACYDGIPLRLLPIYIHTYIFLNVRVFFSAFWVEWFDFINYVCDKSITSPVEAMSKFMKRAIIKIK